MLSQLALIAGGLVLLLWGAERFVAGASASARLFGMSPLLIGLTIVAFGTSAPEILVSAAAALDGSPGLAVGNAVGSNIANIGLVLGVAALLAPMQVQDGLVRRELPLLLLASLLGLALLLDGHLGRLDGVVLLAGLGALLIWFARIARRPHDTPPAAVSSGAAVAEATRMPLGRALVWLVIGLTALLLGARGVVVGAQALALALGIDELLIGVTVLAIGTSLPELAVTVVAALRREHELALGNIVGSNLFNLLAVVGTAGLIGPAPLPPGVLSLHYPVMLGFTVSLFLMAYNWRGGGGGRINRREAAVLLLAFLVYHGMLLLELS